MHYYKFNIKDWTRDTAHLSVIEEGLYRRLLDHYYESEKPIPKETGSVIRRLRLSGHEDVLEVILSEFFVLSDDGYRHKRCDDEISKYHAKAEVNQRNGKSGGRPKTENNPNGYQKKANGNLNHKPLTTNQEPRTIKNNVVAAQQSPTTTTAKTEIAVLDQNSPHNVSPSWLPDMPEHDFRELCKVRGVKVDPYDPANLSEFRLHWQDTGIKRTPSQWVNTYVKSLVTKQVFDSRLPALAGEQNKTFAEKTQDFKDKQAEKAFSTLLTMTDEERKAWGFD